MEIKTKLDFETWAKERNYSLTNEKERSYAMDCFKQELFEAGLESCLRDGVEKGLRNEKSYKNNRLAEKESVCGS